MYTYADQTESDELLWHATDCPKGLDVAAHEWLLDAQDRQTLTLLGLQVQATPTGRHTVALEQVLNPATRGSDGCFDVAFLIGQVRLVTLEPPQLLATGLAGQGACHAQGVTMLFGQLVDLAITAYGTVVQLLPALLADHPAHLCQVIARTRYQHMLQAATRAHETALPQCCRGCGLVQRGPHAQAHSPWCPIADHI